MKVTITEAGLTIEGGPENNQEDLTDMANATLAFLHAVTWAANRLRQETEIAEANHGIVMAIEQAKGMH